VNYLHALLISDVTYQVLYDRINAKVHSKFPSQRFMLFGEDNRLVFGSDSAYCKDAVFLTKKNCCIFLG